MPWKYWHCWWWYPRLRDDVMCSSFDHLLLLARKRRRGRKKRSLGCVGWIRGMQGQNRWRYLRTGPVGNPWSHGFWCWRQWKMFKPVMHGRPNLPTSAFEMVIVIPLYGRGHHAQAMHYLHHSQLGKVQSNRQGQSLRYLLTDSTKVFLSSFLFPVLRIDVHSAVN